MLCHYPDKSCDHKYFDGGNMLLICHVTPRELLFKSLCVLWVEARHPVMSGGYWSSARGDIKYLIYHATSQNT